MKFAKIVFWIAGIWGVLVLTPLYFMFDLIGPERSPAHHPPGILLRIHRSRHWPGSSHFS